MISEAVILQVAQAIERDADAQRVLASHHRSIGFEAGRAVGRQETASADRWRDGFRAGHDAGVTASSAEASAKSYDTGYTIGFQHGRNVSATDITQCQSRIADLGILLGAGSVEQDAEYARGYNNGKSAGYEEGLDSAQHAAYEQGKADANLSYDQGVSDGAYAATRQVDEAYQRGLTQGRQENYQQGYDAGRHIGFRLCKSRVAEDIVNFISEVSES